MAEIRYERIRNWRKSRCDMTPMVFMGSPSLPCPYCWFVHYPADLHKYLPDEAFIIEGEGGIYEDDGWDGLCTLYRNGEERFSFESTYRLCGWNCDHMNETDPSGDWRWSHQGHWEWECPNCGCVHNYADLFRIDNYRIVEWIGFDHLRCKQCGQPA